MTMESNQKERESRERLARVWTQAEPIVSSYVFSAVSGFSDAEDVVQQVALEAARRFDEYDGARPFIGWVLWLAKSRVVDHYRRRARAKVVFSDDLLDRLADAHVLLHENHSGRQSALERCIDKLPERSRRLLERRHVDGEPVDRIAIAERSTAGSVRVMLFRIRNVLSECVERRLASEAR